jgi:CheY-like chemotaxis protein
LARSREGAVPRGAYLTRSPRAVPGPGQAYPHMGPKGTGRTKHLRDLPRVLPLRARADSAEKGVGEPDMIGIMLVEDHLAFRQTLAFLLAREPDMEVVAQAGTLAEAREALERPISGGLDVALIDLGLPDGDGGELIGELRRRSPEVSVVVLSASIDQRRLEEVSRAGAAAVLEKIHSPATIAQEVRRLGGGP